MFYVDYHDFLWYFSEFLLISAKNDQNWSRNFHTEQWLQNFSSSFQVINGESGLVG